MFKRERLIKALILVNIILCIYLVYVQYQHTGYCIIGSSCNDVWNSQYAKFLGMPLSWLGLFAFILLFIIHEIKHRGKSLKRIYFLAVSLGVISALTLIFIQALKLHKFCIACLTIDIITIIMGIITLSQITHPSSQSEHLKA